MSLQERPGVIRVLGILGVATALAGGCGTGLARNGAAAARLRTGRVGHRSGFRASPGVGGRPAEERLEVAAGW